MSYWNVVKFFNSFDASLIIKELGFNYGTNQIKREIFAMEKRCDNENF